MIKLLRDILADKMLEWAGDLIDDPDERDAFSLALVPVLKMRLARYEREYAESKMARQK